MDLVSRFEQWEEWDSSVPLWKHALAGSCAGVAEHIGMYPLDTVKTHMQALRPGGRPRLGDVLRAIVQEQGGIGFMRGATAIATGCIPAHVALFTSYEYTKSRLLEDDGDHEPVRAAFCGAVATVCHDAIITPMDLVKQRMQLGCYRSVGDCLGMVLRREGLGALYRSMPTTLAMNVPFGSVLVASNESIKLSMGLREGNRIDSSSHLPWYFLSAGLSGALASCATQPLDVVKTRLQTQDLLVHSMASAARRSNPSSMAQGVGLAAATTVDGCNVCARCDSVEGSRHFISGPERAPAPKYIGFWSAMRTIVAEEGASALFHGLAPRMVHAIPAAAMCWGTYETVKSFMDG